MATDKPLVSVIVVNWNGQRYLDSCLESIFNQTLTNHEIIVVDNGSVDGSVELLERRYRNKIKLIKNNDNLGFSAGNNQGIANSLGDYLVTLNNDAVAHERWLNELVAAANSDSRTGMCGSKICLFDKTETIDSVGVNIFPDGMSRQRGHLERDTGQYSGIEEILLPSACAALYRKDMLQEIGPFDEDFFAYCEDTDLGLRGRLNGWRAVVVPSAVVYHHYSGSLGKVSPTKAFYVERNHFWVALKIMPVSMLALVPFFTIFRFAAQCWNMLTYSRGTSESKGDKIKKSAIAFAVLRAYVSAARGIPAVLRKRREIRRGKKVSDHEIRSLFKRFRLQVQHLFLDPSP